MAERNITLSVVSHGQNALVNQLLEDIRRTCVARVALVLTENIPDATPLAVDGLACPVARIVNAAVKGFGANHNAAFKRSGTPYFCVCNPDIRLSVDPFAELLRRFTDSTVAAAGPLVRNPAGAIEDSARHFPTIASLLKKLVARESPPEYPIDQGPIAVDWIAGMFMMLRSDAFRSVAGFDERYFLYYEDVDLCRRLGASGMRIVYDPSVALVHDARRASRRNLRLAMHHAMSAGRFLTS